MGINSTDTVWNFGQFGSTFLTGDGAKLDLCVAGAKYYICAITIVEDAAFQHLKSLDGGTGFGLGTTCFAGTEVQAIGANWGGVTNESTTNSDSIGTGNEFPAGITIYGAYDNVELHSGTCIVYVAPRPLGKPKA